VQFHQLDITDEQSCKHFAEFLRQKHDGLDVLINNAGFGFPEATTTVPPAVQADETLAINYYGTKRISESLIPLIRPGGRWSKFLSKSMLNILNKNITFRCPMDKLAFGQKFKLK
jgi:NAD(P)-dependent dehydrogenase (short-subunit alcohol dehydrogenase family)